MTSKFSSRFLRTLWKIASVLALVYIVVIPLVFVYSTDFKSFILFYHTNKEPECPFTQSTCGQLNIRNQEYEFFSISAAQQVKIGAWHIKSAKMSEDIAQKEGNRTCQDLDTIILYLHDSDGNRGTSERIKMYQRFQELNDGKTQVFAIDYRGFGDSTSATMTNEGLIEDAETVYRRIKDLSLKECSKTKFFIWGRGLGAALAGELFVKLKEHSPSGIILETPFPNMLMVLTQTWFYWCFRPMPKLFMDWMFYNQFNGGLFDFAVNGHIQELTNDQLKSVFIIRNKNDKAVSYSDLQIRVPFSNKKDENKRISKIESATGDISTNEYKDINNELWKNITTFMKKFAT